MHKFLLLLFAVVLNQQVHAEIYKYVDESGNTKFTDSAPAEVFQNQEDKSEPDPHDAASLPWELIPAAEVKFGITLKVRSLLENKKIQELEDFLIQIEKEAIQSMVRERELFSAYNAFGLQEKSLFDDWVNQIPSSYTALNARARFYLALAWKSRGTAWASGTSRNQMNGFKEYLKKAKLDIMAALKLNKTSLASYYTWVDITSLTKSKEEFTAVTQQTLSVYPASYIIRMAYLYRMTPRWGGSYELMEEFIQESLKYASQNPKLNWLAGRIHADKAHSFRSQGALKAAEEEYTKALVFIAPRYGESPEYLAERGRIKVKLENYSGALNDYNMAISGNPERALSYFWRSYAHQQLNDNNKSLEDAKLAYALDPYDPAYKKRYEILLSKQNF